MSEWDAFPLAPQQSGGSEWDAFPLAPVPHAPQQVAQQSKWTGAAEGIVNDIGAGLQKVNPVALSEKRGQAVGRLMDGYVDVDGMREPLEKYQSDKYVTRQEGGATYIYPRTDDISEGPLASAGRLAGYGVAEMFKGPTFLDDTTKMHQAAGDVGVTPSFAMGGTAKAKIAAAGEQFFPTAGRFKGEGQRVTDEIATAAGRAADRVGPGITPPEAGEALQHGAQSFVQGVKDKSSLLYGEVDKAIPPSTPMQAPATVDFIKSKIDPLADLPVISKIVGNGKLEAMVSDLESGKLTWTAARQLRTDIGEAMDNFNGPMSDVAHGKLKSIYAALSTDLEAAANAAGPNAARAWSRATTYTRASHERIEQAFQKILKADSPEKAYAILTGMATEGTSSANVQALHKVLRSLPEDDAATVAGTIIRRLGRATSGAQDDVGEVFSSGTFLNNWNKMSKSARAIIARSGMDKGVGKELDKLALVINAKDKADAARNTSNTGNVLTTGALGAALYADPITAAIFSGAAHLTARALTNETFLKAVNSAATGNTSGLMAIAKGKSPLAIEAATLLRLQAEPTSQRLALPAPVAVAN